MEYRWINMGDYLDVTVDTPVLTGKFCVNKDDIAGWTDDLDDAFRDMLSVENYVENTFLGNHRMYDIVFKNAEALYEMIIDDEDFYCEDEKIYVFHYNDNVSICYYSGVSRQDAEKYARDAMRIEECWESVIPGHGFIIDEPSAAIAFCENLLDKHWISRDAFERRLEVVA